MAAGRPVRAPDARTGGGVRGERGGAQREARVPRHDHLGRGGVVPVVQARVPDERAKFVGKYRSAKQARPSGGVVKPDINQPKCRENDQEADENRGQPVELYGRSTDVYYSTGQGEYILSAKRLLVPRCAASTSVARCSLAGPSPRSPAATHGLPLDFARSVCFAQRFCEKKSTVGP